MYVELLIEDGSSKEVMDILIPKLFGNEIDIRLYLKSSIQSIMLHDGTLYMDLPLSTRAEKYQGFMETINPTLQQAGNLVCFYV